MRPPKERGAGPRNGSGVGHPLEVRVRAIDLPRARGMGWGECSAGHPKPTGCTPAEPAMRLHHCWEPSSNCQTATTSGTLASRRGQKDNAAQEFEKRILLQNKTEREGFIVRFTVPHWVWGLSRGVGLLRKFRVVTIQKLQCAWDLNMGSVFSDVTWILCSRMLFIISTEVGQSGASWSRGQPGDSCRIKMRSRAGEEPPAASLSREEGSLPSGWQSPKAQGVNATTGSSIHT